MKPRLIIVPVAIFMALAILGSNVAEAQSSQPGMCCMGSGRGGCAGSGSHGMAQDMPSDMGALHQLLQRRDTFQRQVTNLPNGIESITRSSDPAVAAVLQTHVDAMAKRLEERRPIHSRDPLFAEIFSHARDIRITIEPLADGVHVTETSDDPYVAKLIQEHAGIVNLFIERGMTEMHRDHPLPAKP